jgi:hypothetical protein
MKKSLKLEEKLRKDSKNNLFSKGDNCMRLKDFW